MTLAAHAQTTPAIRTFVCTEPDYENGVQTQYYRAYFGYHSTSATNIFIPNGPNNYFNPDPQGNYVGMPINFTPGYHEKEFFIRVPLNAGTNWIVANTQTAVSNSPALRCGNITYQGRLNDGAAAANGSYDLQFEFYGAAIGGAAQSGKIRLENVAVTNGVFTVQLDVGATFINKIFEPKFLEIGVRPGSMTGNDGFTILSPRQPLTQAPYAINAQTAANAQTLGGLPADSFLKINSSPDNLIQNSATAQNASINITGTLTSGCRSGFTAFAGGRLCVSAMQAAATFVNAVTVCKNMGARVGNSGDAMLTFTDSNFNYFGGVASGWLADHIGNDVWGTWNVSVPNPNFDGAPQTVSGAKSPALPFRCVY